MNHNRGKISGKQTAVLFALCMLLIACGCGKEVQENEQGDTSSIADTKITEAESGQEETETEADIDTDTGKAELETLDFSELVQYKFDFRSGSGAWMTIMYIDSQGVFEGEYIDDNMGASGDGYPNGTRYQSNFTGKFTEPVKINEYTYSMRIQEISYEKECGTEEIIDGKLYRYVDAYGLRGAEELLLYAPGAPIAELPEGYMIWAGYHEEAELPFWGIYDAAQEHGFASENFVDELKKAVDSQAKSAASLEASIQNDELTQAEYNEKARALYNTWDIALNKVWQVLQQILDEETMSALTDEELEWIAMKEQAVTEAGDEVAGGSMQPMVMDLKAAELTKIRVYELLELLE